jgi:hypothetical protein
MRKVYAFEWCDLIYESGFSIVSLHMTKRGAFKAMTRFANAKWYEERMGNKYCKKIKNDPLWARAWQVITIALED